MALRRIWIGWGYLAVSIFLAALVTLVGFWAFVVSVHDDSNGDAILRHIALPLVPLLRSSRIESLSNAEVWVRIIVGFGLWGAAVYALLVSWRRHSLIGNPPNDPLERTRS
jgi:hypothetical protein